MILPAGRIRHGDGAGWPCFAAASREMLRAIADGAWSPNRWRSVLLPSGPSSLARYVTAGSGKPLMCL
ncbi:MAG TPA: hypothetical protein VLR47_05295 [Rhodospirillales bacterium]|nr:hypothetical protein [Rhodospirillales bacterium]